MKLHHDAIALVAGSYRGEHKRLGSAFCFLKPCWFVTAKHVVLDDCGEKRNLLHLKLGGGGVASIGEVHPHPHHDLAIIEVEGDGCAQPLYPAHWEHDPASPMVKMGYSPSVTGEQGRLVINAVAIPSYDTYERERDTGKEVIFEFDDPSGEGGNSGGPLFSAGGGVAAVVIEQHSHGNSARTKATDVKVLMDFVGLK